MRRLFLLPSVVWAPAGRQSLRRRRSLSIGHDDARNDASNDARIDAPNDASAGFVGAFAHCASNDIGVCAYDLPRGRAFAAAARNDPRRAGRRDNRGCRSNAFAVQAGTRSITAVRSFSRTSIQRSGLASG